MGVGRVALVPFADTLKRRSKKTAGSDDMVSVTVCVKKIEREGGMWCNTNLVGFVVDYYAT